MNTGNHPVYPGMNTGNQPVFSGVNTRNQPVYPGMNTGNQPVYPGMNTGTQQPLYPNMNTGNQPVYPGMNTANQPIYPGMNAPAPEDFGNDRAVKPEESPEEIPPEENFPEEELPDKVPFYESKRHNLNRPNFSEGMRSLPRLSLQMLQEPAGTLRLLMEQENRTAPLIALVLALIAAFLCGLFMSRGIISGYLQILRETNLGIAQNVTGALNDRVNMRVALGVLACEAASLPLHALLFCGYVCLIRRYSFSIDLALGALFMAAVPGVMGSVLGMLLSLVSPYGVMLAALLAELLTLGLYAATLRHRLDPRDGTVLPQLWTLLGLMLVCWGILWLMLGGHFLEEVRGVILRALNLAAK